MTYMIYTAIRTRLFDFLGFFSPALILRLLVQKYPLGTTAIPCTLNDTKMSSGFATGTDEGKEAEIICIRCSNTWRGGKYGSKSTSIGLVMIDAGMMGCKTRAARSMDEPM